MSQNESLEEIERKIYQLKLQKLEQLKADIALQQGLPHIYGWPWYKWAWEIYNSKNREIFLTSANQVSKSSTAIRKNIMLATSPEKWKEFWPGLREGHAPSLFWYVMPTTGTCTTEFENKWVKEFLPRGDFKNDKKYGWKEEYFKGEIYAVNFNSDIQIQFKSYEMKIKNLQSSSVFHMTCDEEVPVDYLAEFKSRLNATDGYFLNPFTATLGQDHWRLTMEPTTHEEEKHPDALKIQVSLFDCQKYIDGSPSPWTDEKIKRAIANCPTPAEVQRRIYGRFVKTEGLLLSGFSHERNMCEAHPLPKDWLVYGAIDPGSGGEKGHPTGIVFVAVNPQYTKGRVFRGWRGDGVITDHQRNLNEFRTLRKNLNMSMQIYDFHAKDFFLVASQQGENFVMANKARDFGFGILNTLFKNEMLKIQSGDPELSKLVSEITSLSSTKDKREAKDDMCFHGDTKIFTNKGDKKIKDISLGDLVLTRKGFRPVAAKMISIGKMHGYECDGNIIYATKNHKFILSNGEEKEVCKINGEDYCQVLLESEKQRLLSLRVSNLEDIQSQFGETTGPIIPVPVTIKKMELILFIAKYTKNLLDLFQMAMLFIILMGIHLIMILRISKLFHLVSICLYTPLRRGELLFQEKILRQQDSRLLNGIRVMSLKIFIKNLVKKVGRILHILIKSVGSVINLFLLCLSQPIDRNFVRTSVAQSREGHLAKMISKKYVRFVEKITSQTNTQDKSIALQSVHITPQNKNKIGFVYNITVDCEHEYFANDILVANCDALRYACASIPWDFSSIELPEELKVIEARPKAKTSSEERRDFFSGQGDFKNSDTDDIDAELDYWNEQY